MIPRAALEDFLYAKRHDHRWIKKLSERELDAALDALRPPTRLYSKARKHQKACFLLGVAWPRFGFWLDMGTGKTLLALELLRYWYDNRLFDRALILLTSDKAYLTWEKQIKRYGIDVPYVFLDGSSADKWEQLERFGSGFVLVHYPGLVAMLTQRGGRKWIIDEDKVERFARGIGGLAADESTKLGNQGSLTYQLVERIAARCRCRYALAGRPFGRDPTLAWSQFKLIDGGATLGETQGLFREAFFSKSESGRSTDYKFKKRMMPQLTRLLQNSSITYSESECPDLPPLARTPEVDAVRLPEEAELYYERLVGQIIEAKGNYTQMENVFTRMRQLSSGFLALRDKENDERVEVEFEENPKLDRLMERIEELPPARQAVVFYEFTHSGRTIMQRLKQAGVDGIWLWSGTKNPKEDLLWFMRNGCQVAVVNNRVGAYSLDGLQCANYDFFYESPVSVIDRVQAEKRIWRQGQERHVFQYDLVVRGTMDEKILEFHEEGRDLYEALTAAPEKLFNIPALGALT